MNATEENQTETAREKFKRLYLESLSEAVRNHPKEYAWPIEKVPEVAARMFKAIDANAFFYNSTSFKILAKKLGIKPTRTAILAAWNA